VIMKPQAKILAPKVNPLVQYFKNTKEYLSDEIFYPIRIFFRVKYEAICRALSYAKFAWDLYDFESHSMFALMAFKLKRVQKCMKEGYGVYPRETTNAMKESIKILDRLYKEEYEKPYRKNHDKKWGRLNFDRKLDKDDLFIHWNTYRTGIKTDQDHKNEHQDFLTYMEAAHQDRLNDFDRLNDLLKKYQGQWWD
jgi:hypothetical protein